MEVEDTPVIQRPRTPNDDLPFSHPILSNHFEREPDFLAPLAFFVIVASLLLIMLMHANGYMSPKQSDDSEELHPAIE